jgi:acyl-CoA synthetase (NDP forming)/RimJ/RimL family protein N-acetyltransferase
VADPDGSAGAPAAGYDALLSDGSTVHIRRIEPDDADRVVALHGRFSERTRYLRWFSPYPRIPPRDLVRTVNVDHRDREALVVATGEQLVAMGSYERLGPSSSDAEVAFAVEDAFQGRGIGPLLLEHLAAAARGAGIARFVAEVLPANRPMLRVLADAGYQVSRQFDEGVVHLTFPIEPTPESEQISRAREHHPEAASIARLLTPRSVLVYGVRRDGTGAGATLLRTIVAGGYTGTVGAVHPAAPDLSTLEGVPVYPSAANAPGPVDLAVVAVPWDRVPAAVADAGAAGAHAVVVVSGGFAEVRASGIGAQRDLVALARGHGMRLVGPNCLGVVNTDPAVSLNATLVPRLVPHGRIGVFCQSGFVGVAMLSEIHERGLGVSTFGSVGNRADVSGNDLLQYWREDPHTDVVLLYLETFGNPHKFARIARELSRDKPVVTVAAGAAAGLRRGLYDGDVSWVDGRPPEEEAVAALVAHSGVIRVDTVSELLDVGQILAACPLPAGSRVGVVGNAAALVQLAETTAARAGLDVTHTRWTLPGASPRMLKGLVGLALQHDEVDAVLAVVAPVLPESTVDEAVDAIAAAVDEAGADAAPGSCVDKPVLAVVMGFPARVDRAVPRFRAVEEAVRALAHVTRYAQWRRMPVGVLPSLSGADSSAGRALVARLGSAQELLAAYGVPVLATMPASTVDGALDAAKALGYPVAVKSAAPELRHRRDLGAVRLDVGSARTLRQAYDEISASFGPSVLVQPMAPHGVDCEVSVLDDPSFGPVVGFGVGGIATELLGDTAWRVAPLTDVDAAALVRAPRAAQLLQGHRGAPPVDLAAIEDLLLRVGRLADDNPAVKRLTLNPVLTHSTGLSVVHASVVYGDPQPRPDTGPRRLL